MLKREGVTISVIKADVGGFVGHTNVHPALLDTAKEYLHFAKEKSRIKDYHVMRCGDGLELILTHFSGEEDEGIHSLAWDVINMCARQARELKLTGAGEDLLAPDFTGTLRGLGPVYAELEFGERESEPIIILMADKAASGSWNLPLYKIFSDPFNTASLLTDERMSEGFTFDLCSSEGEGDVAAGSSYKTPHESYALLAKIGQSSRHAVSRVLRSLDNEPAAAASVFSGVSVGEDSVAIIRCEDGLPSVVEALEVFSFPYLTRSSAEGSHTGPLMPVPFYEATPLRFNGPPRVIAAGFQISNGRLIGGHDMFDDPGFDEARRMATELSGYMRRHGPFEPHYIKREVIRKNSPDISNLTPIRPVDSKLS
jgi:fructose 1,6-bisphosphate aldolase/phosphatase